MNVGYKVAQIVCNHTANQAIEENEKLTKQLQYYQQVNVLDSYRDTTFAFGNINQGCLTDSIVHEHGMYEVPLTSNRFVTTMTQFSVHVGTIVGSLWDLSGIILRSLCDDVIMKTYFKDNIRIICLPQGGSNTI